MVYTTLRRLGPIRTHARAPVVFQSETAECGLACLAMVAAAYGNNLSLIDLRRRFSVSAKGMDLQAMMGIADGLGLAPRPVRLDLMDFYDLKAPAILHWDMRHFVVFVRVRGDRILIHDPARGRRWIDRETLSRSFTGVALEFTPSPGFQRSAPTPRVRISEFFVGIHGLIPSILQALVLALVLQVFALASPIVNQLIVDEAITKGDGDLLTVFAASMGLLLITTVLIRVLQGYVGLYMTTQLSLQMQTNLLRHTLRLPVGWFERRHIGDIMSRFSSLGPVKDFLLSAVTSFTLNAMMTAFSMTMMFLYAPLLAALEVLSVAIFAGIRACAFPYFRAKTDENLHLSAKVETTFLETIRGARTFKMFGKEGERLAIWQNEQVKLANSQVQLAKFGLLGTAGSGLLLGIQQIIGWYLGARMVISGELTLGMLFAFQAYTGQFGASTAGLITQFFSFSTLRLHLERLGDIAHAEQERGLECAAPHSNIEFGRVSLAGVSFRYAEHEPWVLRNIELEVDPGEFVCLQGPSGQGKTTILKLLLGFYDPVEGEVQVDGINVRSLGIRHLRRRVGAVLQDDQLFAGTIADNIAFFDPAAKIENVEEAAKAAQIHGEIIQLPMSYETLCGDLGSTLSAGQRQRVLLARALYRRPSILVLDEGTANLDPNSEARVMDVISSMNITRIVVAHRPGASLGASRFINVMNGRIVE